MSENNTRVVNSVTYSGLQIMKSNINFLPILSNLTALARLLPHWLLGEG